MHNDVVKLRAGAVQRGANHRGQSYLNLDSSHAARQLQPHVMRHFSFSVLASILAPQEFTRLQEEFLIHTVLLHQPFGERVAVLSRRPLGLVGERWVGVDGVGVSDRQNLKGSEHLLAEGFVDLGNQLLLSVRIELVRLYGSEDRGVTVVGQTDWRRLGRIGEVDILLDKLHYAAGRRCNDLANALEPEVLDSF